VARVTKSESPQINAQPRATASLHGLRGKPESATHLATFSGMSAIAVAKTCPSSRQSGRAGSSRSSALGEATPSCLSVSSKPRTCTRSWERSGEIFAGARTRRVGLCDRGFLHALREKLALNTFPFAFAWRHPLPWLVKSQDELNCLPGMIGLAVTLRVTLDRERGRFDSLSL